MDIRPVRNDADHEAALKEIEALWGALDETEEGDRLDVLATLVEAYEDRRWPLEDADPVEAIEAAMAYEGHSRADLGRLIGPSRATEILQRKRALTLPMIRKIARAWHVPERLLVNAYPLRGKPTSTVTAHVPNAQTKAAIAQSRQMLKSRQTQAGSVG